MKISNGQRAYIFEEYGINESIESVSNGLSAIEEHLSSGFNMVNDDGLSFLEIMDELGSAYASYVLKMETLGKTATEATWSGVE